METKMRRELNTKNRIVGVSVLPFMCVARHELVLDGSPHTYSLALGLCEAHTTMLYQASFGEVNWNGNEEVFSAQTLPIPMISFVDVVVRRRRREMSVGIVFSTY